MKSDWQIDEFRFVPELNQLEGSNGETHLEPRTSAVLLDLVEHAGRVRTRDELLSAVWDDAFVGEAALTHCIWELRKAFGDDARNPRFIQTVPRRGYRLIADAAQSSTRRLGTLLWIDSSQRGPVDEAVEPVDAVRLAAPSGRLLLFDRPVEAVQHAVALSDRGGFAAARAVVHMDELRLDPSESSDAAPTLDDTTSVLMQALRNAARPGQILLTAGAFDMARRAAGDAAGHRVPTNLRWSALGPFALQGFDEPVELFEVAGGDSAPLGAPESSGEFRPLESLGKILGWRPGPGIRVPQRPHWVLREKLGEGSFGEVWLSEHGKTKDRRVFKFCFEFDRLRALQREVTLLRLLKESLGERDDIVHLLDWNFDEAPFFLEMEYTSAGSLEAWAGSHGGLKAIPLKERLELVAQAAEALAGAHSVGVLHKDVKPANILVHIGHDAVPKVRLGDFGIGHILDRSRLEDAGITVLGLTRLDEGSSSDGTRLYMSPETLEGREPSTEADVFALGLVLYQVTVGAFDRAIAEGWQRDVDDPLLAEDISQCLDQTPERRPSAREVADRLRRLDERRTERARAERLKRETEENRRALAASQRRRRLWLVAAALTTAVAVVVSILAVQATRARAEAERSRLQAEDLVSFMLGDLGDTLAGVGRLDAMDGTLEKVLEYLGGDDPSGLSDADLDRRARALHQVGSVRMRQGDLDAARAVFEDASGLTRHLLDRDPENAEHRANDGDSRYWLGYVFDQQGELDRAEEAYEEHRRAYEVLMEREPSVDRWNLELSYGYQNVARIAVLRGELDTALVDYQRARELLELLALRAEDDADLLLDLAGVHTRIGLVEQRRGRLESALASYSADRDLLARLLDQSPDDTRLRQRMATSGTQLVSVLLDMGRPAAALDEARKNVEIRRDLVALEPENDPWRHFLANELRWLGQSLLDSDSSENARVVLEEARQILETQGPSQARTLEVQRSLGIVFRLLAKVENSLGLGDSARRNLDRSLAVLESLAATQSEDVLTAANLAWAYGARGDSLAEKDPAAARRAWQRGVDAVQPFLKRSADPTFLAPLSVLLLRLGEEDRAQPIVNQLRAMDYRSAAFLGASRLAGPEI